LRAAYAGELLVQIGHVSDQAEEKCPDLLLEKRFARRRQPCTRVSKALDICGIDAAAVLSREQLVTGLDEERNVVPGYRREWLRRQAHGWAARARSSAVQ
jgi:hypothetical protein